MAIIVSKDHQNAERVDPSDFSLESDMQKYIIDNPSVIPLYDIDEDIRLFVAAREFQTKSGPIDALGFDQNGNIYVVETKLYRNPDKRTVVAQALDYGASLWRHATSFDDFVNALDSHCNKQFQASFQQKLEEFFELSETENIVSSIQSNLNSGNIKFVVMMDSLDSRLKDLIVYVNQNSHFDIYAVELEYYKHNEFEIMIPKIFGDEVKKEVVSKSTNNRWIPISRDEWLGSIRGELADNVRRISDIYDTIGQKTGLSGKAMGDYYHIILSNSERYSRFFGDNIKSADIEICNNGQISFFGFLKKDSQQMQFARKVAERIVQQGLFNKNDTHLQKQDFNIMYSQMNIPDSITLVEIHEEVAREMGWL